MATLRGNRLIILIGLALIATFLLVAAVRASLYVAGRRCSDHPRRESRRGDQSGDV